MTARREDLGGGTESLVRSNGWITPRYDTANHRLFFRGRFLAVSSRCREPRLVRRGPHQGPAELRRAGEVRAAGHDARPRLRRPAGCRVRAREAPLSADPG